MIRSHINGTVKLYLEFLVYVVWIRVATTVTKLNYGNFNTNVQTMKRVEKITLKSLKSKN